MNEMTQVLGIVAMEPKGEYSSETYYEKLNVVTYQGSSYCAKTSVLGVLPTNTEYWELIAEKGNKGDTGAAGATGATGPAPIKGVDYYTAADKAELEADIDTDITAEVSSQLSTLTSATPLAVPTAADMTDTTRIYVLTTDGHWYWYDGDSWEDGGTYQASVSSSETSAINDNEKKLYKNITGTFTTSPNREYGSYSFIKGKLYNVKIKLNTFTPTDSTSTINLACSLSSDNQGTSVFNLIPDTTSTNIQNSYEIEFIAPDDANYIYLYYRGKSSTTYDIDITITSPLGNTLLDKDNFIFDESTKKIKNISNIIGEKYAYTLNTTITSSTNRYYFPFNFKQGYKYNIEYELETFTKEGNSSTDALVIRTTTSEDNTNVIDTIITYKNGELRNYGQLEFVASGNASYVYLYTHFATGALKINANVKEILDEIKFDNSFEYNPSTKVLSIAGQTILPYSYYGEKISLKANTFDCNQYKTLTTQTNDALQGMAIYDGKIFQLQKKGILSVYDLNPETSTSIGYTNLGSYGDGNHANCCNFSNKFYNNNTIPLLYVSSGYPGTASMRCFVENVTISESTISSTLIQTITLDQSGFVNAGYEPIWNSPTFMVSPDNKYLYVFGSKYRTNGSMSEYDLDNKYIITKFKYPDLSNSTVTLTDQDVIEQFVTEYPVDYTQGGTLSNDKIIFCFGSGAASHPTKIGVWNVNSKSLDAVIDLSSTPLNNKEPEDASVYNNKLYITAQNKNIYELEF